jgi:hypothetical protein
MTYPTHDVEYEGVVLPKDQPVVISLAAANTDPMLTAEHREGNRAHLAWSAGAHTCPAQGQARLITSVAIEKVLDALPEMELAVPDRLLKWRPGPFHRALTALPVNFPPAAGRMAGDAWRDRPDTDTRPDLRVVPRRGAERPDGLAAVLSAARARPVHKNRYRQWRDSARKWFRRL